MPADYFKHHGNLDEVKRAKLVDWLVEMQEAFEMNHETLYMAVSIMDRYCSRARRIPRESLQLMACASALVAAKVEVRSRR